MHEFQNDNHVIDIIPNKTPAGEHACRFYDAPVVDIVVESWLAFTQ